MNEELSIEAQLFLYSLERLSTPASKCTLKYQDWCSLIKWLSHYVTIQITPGNNITIPRLSSLSKKVYRELKESIKQHEICLAPLHSAVEHLFDDSMHVPTTLLTSNVNSIVLTEELKINGVALQESTSLINNYSSFVYHEISLEKSDHSLVSKKGWCVDDSDRLLFTIEAIENNHNTERHHTWLLDCIERDIFDELLKNLPPKIRNLEFLLSLIMDLIIKEHLALPKVSIEHCIAGIFTHKEFPTSTLFHHGCLMRLHSLCKTFPNLFPECILFPIMKRPEFTAIYAQALLLIIEKKMPSGNYSMLGGEFCNAFSSHGTWSDGILTFVLGYYKSLDEKTIGSRSEEICLLLDLMFRQNNVLGHNLKFSQLIHLLLMKYRESVQARKSQLLLMCEENRTFMKKSLLALCLKL